MKGYKDGNQSFDARLNGGAINAFKVSFFISDISFSNI